LLAAKAARSKETPELEFMPSHVFSLPPIVEQVRASLPKDQEIYLVGGAVRDLLLNRALRDIDFAVPGKAIPLARKVAKALGADFYPLDLDRDAGRVIVQDEADKRLVLDFVGMQENDIDRDLGARDVTINAMAIDLRQPGALLDPLGGAADLVAKKVRACSGRSFSSDPVRVLRAIRMAASFGLNIEKETRELMRAAAPSLSSVSPERLRDELFRLVMAPKRAASFRALDLLGALEPVLPELMPLKGLEQPAPHLFDVWEHSLHVLDGLEKVMMALAPEYPTEGAGDLQSGLIVLSLGRYRDQLGKHLETEVVLERPRRALLVFAALLHDTGKARTRSVGKDGRIHFYEHEERGAEIIAERADALHLSNSEHELLVTIVANHMRPMQLTQTGELPSRKAIYRFFRATGETGVDICLLSLADLLGKYGSEVPEDKLRAHLDTLRTLLEAYYEHPQESVSPPVLLNGDELMTEMKLKPGPKVGELLEALWEAQATGEVTTRVQAVEFMKSMLK
jgi:tRNA nucleotidyltransferase/poly(A) polymerase